MRIILVGFGVVGQSLARIFLQRRPELVRSYGFNPKLVAVVDKGGAAVNMRGLDLEEILSLKVKEGTVAASRDGRPDLSALEVIESVEAEVMVEVTPTNIKDGEPGLSHIKSAFRTGKSVVTTNKGPLALALPALTELAEYNGVHLRFSGTVGAGTPVLDLAKKCLLGDRIISIRGVLNGTTNYILTEMEEKHISFHQALKDAQRLGYAEANPSMDVDGLDTACKIVIMANWIMGRKVTLKDVKIEGIRNVTREDLEEASRRGRTIRLLGFIDKDLKVAPTEISKGDPLAVKGVLNAVTFTSEFTGEETIIGRGAGGMATASAVLRDLINIKEALSSTL
ncbi:homoserine dehydrogenase [Candidatus Bathyarchaeota archaeon]|nr:MAG: homoserine dehydrogenase [Candidatus Bathyarchaeota archaeon ex4484_40]RJS80116.1 MAG: homoserine dehydrogenase [Candidatus Bathyarchaeota archaeon]RLG97793.1 MAG: homoserine dehydrogenase [Candidatus Bathyarchaeota archaeon]HDJ05011.1 homoserine dehydrogenase [Candidatus Bathyarchaeota archaeon]